MHTEPEDKNIIRDRTWIKNTQKSTNAPDQFQFSHNFRIAIQSHDSALYFLLLSSYENGDSFMV